MKTETFVFKETVFCIIKFKKKPPEMNLMVLICL